MSPRFRVVHGESTAGHHCSYQWPCPTWSSNDYEFQFFQHITTSVAYFGVFSFRFSCVSTSQGTFTVTASSDNCDNSSHFRTIVARADNYKRLYDLSDLKRVCASDWLKKCAITAPKSVQLLLQKVCNLKI